LIVGDEGKVVIGLVAKQLESQEELVLFAYNINMLVLPPFFFRGKREARFALEENSVLHFISVCIAIHGGRS
jgi:hypothetical protein